MPWTYLRTMFAPSGASGTTVRNATDTGQLPVEGLTVDQLLTLLGAGAASAAGVNVTPELAMRVSTVYACVALIAGAIASLPLAFFERQPTGRARRVDAAGTGQLWWLFNEQANEEFSSFDTLQLALATKLLNGDGYIELQRGPGRQIVGLKAHPYQRVTPFRNYDNGEKFYRVIDIPGKDWRVVFEPDMLHLGSIGYDPITMRSPSVITYAAREAVGVSIAAESFNAKLFSGGATFDYALKVPATLKKEQVDALKASLLARLEQNSRFPLLLTGGMEPANLMLSPKDAEVLATRSFTVEDIARFFGVPPHMIGHQEKSTSFGTGIEQQSIAFARYTLMRHIRPLVQEINRKVWPVRQRFFADFDLVELERTDTASRFNAYRVALGRAGEPGFMSQNEVRERERLAPIAGGDDINQGTLPAINQPPAEPAPAEPAPAEPAPADPSTL